MNNNNNDNNNDNYFRLSLVNPFSLYSDYHWGRADLAIASLALALILAAARYVFWTLPSGPVLRAGTVFGGVHLLTWVHFSKEAGKE